MFEQMHPWFGDGGLCQLVNRFKDNLLTLVYLDNAFGFSADVLGFESRQALPECLNPWITLHCKNIEYINEHIKQINNYEVPTLLKYTFASVC